MKTRAVGISAKTWSAKTWSAKTWAAAIILVPLLGCATATAQKMNADDLKWVNKCIDDNKGGASATVIRKYCMCMNEKMDDNETQSISTWEKSHPKERAACDKESGWK